MKFGYGDITVGPSFDDDVCSLLFIDNGKEPNENFVLSGYENIHQPNTPEWDEYERDWYDNEKWKNIKVAMDYPCDTEHRTAQSIKIINKQIEYLEMIKHHLVEKLNMN